MTNTNASRLASLAGASILAFGLGLGAAPGMAHAGFLDQLFGGAPQMAPPPTPSYGYREPPPFYEDAPAQPRAKRKVVDAKPKLQKPTDIMHDATLQNGDVVVAKSGMTVYVGDDGEAKHGKDDFQPLDDVSGMPKEEYKALVAMDTTRNDPLRGATTPDTLASGRSAAVANPITQGRTIVDARGKTVRYVGP